MAGGEKLLDDAAGGGGGDDVTTCRTEGGDVSDPDSWSGLLPTEEEDDALSPFSAAGESLSVALFASGSSVAPGSSATGKTTNVK